MSPHAKYPDPAAAVDRLPQPYRLIDKLLADLITDTFAHCARRDAERAHAAGQRIQKARARARAPPWALAGQWQEHPAGICCPPLPRRRPLSRRRARREVHSGAATNGCRPGRLLRLSRPRSPPPPPRRSPPLTAAAATNTKTAPRRSSSPPAAPPTCPAATAASRWPSVRLHAARPGAAAAAAAAAGRRRRRRCRVVLP